VGVVLGLCFGPLGLLTHCARVLLRLGGAGS
jgi:hypothetical protein